MKHRKPFCLLNGGKNEWQSVPDLKKSQTQSLKVKKQYTQGFLKVFKEQGHIDIGSSSHPASSCSQKWTWEMQEQSKHKNSSSLFLPSPAFTAQKTFT